jgi:hypothetical protein
MQLCQRLSAWLVPDVLPLGAAVPFSPPLCDEIERRIERLSADE